MVKAFLFQNIVQTWSRWSNYLKKKSKCSNKVPSLTFESAVVSVPNLRGFFQPELNSAQFQEQLQNNWKKHFQGIYYPLIFVQCFLQKPIHRSVLTLRAYQIWLNFFTAAFDSSHLKSNRNCTHLALLKSVLYSEKAKYYTYTLPLPSDCCLCNVHRIGFQQQQLFPVNYHIHFINGKFC